MSKKSTTEEPTTEAATKDQIRINLDAIDELEKAIYIICFFRDILGYNAGRQIEISLDDRSLGGCNYLLSNFEDILRQVIHSLENEKGGNDNEEE